LGGHRRLLLAMLSHLILNILMHLQCKMLCVLFGKIVNLFTTHWQRE
jgi:hypothetical protein